jgi:solute carrier family 25 protein 16
MFLPHIPNDIAAHLPSLFNIYCRILFWDRERVLRILSPEAQPDHADPEKHVAQTNETNEAPEWEKLSYYFESDNETVPELLHYFTFLYGLYPINFMSYIRKPERYLRHANFHGRDDVEVQPSEIRQRSEPFRQAHLLHPNFYTMTIESELTDLNRWMNSEASDVLAACMALYRPLYQGLNSQPGPPGPGGLPDVAETNAANGDASDQPLLARNDEGIDEYRRVSSDAPSASWRNTTSTIVDTPDDSRRQSSAERKPSQSTSMPIADSPTLGPLEMQTDSPTLPPQLLLTDSQDKFERVQRFQGGLQQSLPNESEISFISSQHREPSIADSYLQSMEKHQAPRSPSLHPSPTEGDSIIASLRRELMLLKNELNFERYLKQQHLSHIGQLRRKHVKHATVEADTQNLINSNKMLRNKLDEAKNTAIQMKKESEKSRSHAKKWEAELTVKLRALKEEQKKWNVETEALRRDLESSQASNNELRQLIVKREAEALASRQKVQSIEGNVDEIERLRAEVEKLTGSLRTYEAREVEIERAKASEALALTKVDILEIKLKARENELEIAKLTADREMDALKMELEETRLDMHDRMPQNFQSMLDTALAVSRLRLMEAQKAHGHLLMKFNKLQGQYLTLKDHRNPDEPLLSGDGDDSPYDFGSSYPTGSSPPIRRTIRRRGLSDPDLGERNSHSFGSPSENSSSYFPIRPARVDTTVSAPRPSSQDDTRTPSKGLPGSGAIGHMRSGSADSAQANAGLNPTATGLSLDATGKPKIKPSSDIRVYGRGSYSRSSFIQVFSGAPICIVVGSFSGREWRLTAHLGGVQNVGTTPKPKKDKKKDDPDKKDKKGAGLRGIRGFT